jgi:hypothetical protein
MEKIKDDTRPKINGTIKLVQKSKNQLIIDSEITMDKEDFIKN